MTRPLADNEAVMEKLWHERLSRCRCAQCVAGATRMLGHAWVTETTARLRDGILPKRRRRSA
jgi:hypothetical protein